MLDEPALGAPEVRKATQVGRVPTLPARVAAQIRQRFGRLDYERDVAAPLLAARASVLGERAAAPPRLLVRVDEFPHYRAWDEPGRFGKQEFERFHAIMADAGVAYLIAALPRVSRNPLAPGASGSRPLDDGEGQLLRRLRGEGVTLGLHGLDHRTRHSSPRRHSELCGLDATATEELVERAVKELARHGLAAPEVFVAPYNRFDARQLNILARRFAIVCGGPESIGTVGFQRTPQWRGETVYLPSYAPFYGRAAEIAHALDRAVERATGLWTPLVLHWGWEAESGWSDLERLAPRLSNYAVPWDHFLQAVRRSHGGTVAQAGSGAATDAGGD